MATHSGLPKPSWQVEVDAKGAWIRKPTTFRERVTADGSSGFQAEAGRYHIYISHACPWAHRTVAVRQLKGLEDVISVSTVDWLLAEGGWRFTPEFPDPLHADFGWLRQVYLMTDPEYAGKITVPVLFDKQRQVIVNNESSEIIRMLNTEFNAFAKNPALDLYPEPLREAVDAVNEWVYKDINDGVYKCGFSRSQEAYNDAFRNLFNSLDRAEAILSKQRYLTGDRLTEADVRLWTTLVRFDPVYVTHFKTNKKRIAEYPNLLGFLRELCQTCNLLATIDIDHTKKHYFCSHIHINPFGIVPGGLDVDYTTPHDRQAKFPV